MNKENEEKKEVAVVEGKEVVVQTSPVVEMTQMLLSKDVKPEDLEKMLVIYERDQETQAKKAYHVAMTAFKAEVPQVSKDKENTQYGSKYTSLNNLVNTVNPILSKHGLSASWDIEQVEKIKVVCSITHILGHSESASMTAKPDTSGSKNEIQQIKSAITYLKSVTFESICGIASTDANLDDDGNSAGAAEDCITEEELSKIKDYTDNFKEFDEAKFLKHFQIESLAKMPKSIFHLAMIALDSKKKLEDKPSPKKVEDKK